MREKLYVPKLVSGREIFIKEIDPSINYLVGEVFEFNIDRKIHIAIKNFKRDNARSLARSIETILIVNLPSDRSDERCKAVLESNMDVLQECTPIYNNGYFGATELRVLSSNFYSYGEIIAIDGIMTADYGSMAENDRMIKFENRDAEVILPYGYLDEFLFSFIIDLLGKAGNEEELYDYLMVEPSSFPFVVADEDSKTGWENKKVVGETGITYIDNSTRSTIYKSDCDLTLMVWHAMFINIEIFNMMEIEMSTTEFYKEKKFEIFDSAVIKFEEYIKNSLLMEDSAKSDYLYEDVIERRLKKIGYKNIRGEMHKETGGDTIIIDIDSVDKLITFSAYSAEVSVSFHFKRFSDKLVSMVEEWITEIVAEKENYVPKNNAKSIAAALLR